MRWRIRNIEKTDVELTLNWRVIVVTSMPWTEVWTIVWLQNFINYLLSTFISIHNLITATALLQQQKLSCRQLESRGPVMLIIPKVSFCRLLHHIPHAQSLLSCTQSCNCNFKSSLPWIISTVGEMLYFSLNLKAEWVVTSMPGLWPQSSKLGK